MNKGKNEIKRGRPAVIKAQAMVLFRNNEKEFFDEWLKSREISQEEKDLLGINKSRLGISDGLRFLMIKGIELETGKKLKKV